MVKKQKNNRTYISIIIPAYQQEKTIQKDIRHIRDVMNQIRSKYEIIVVIDGFIDNTYQKAKKIKSKNITIIGYQNNKGKGYAVRYGMAKAKGNIIAFIDSGMDINPNGINMLLEHFKWYNADIIVGSKLHPVSKVNYPVIRRILSWCYRTLVKILFGLSIRDTQVGIKFFRKKVLDDVLPRLEITTYAFDIELLAVAHSLGYRRIYEAPIELDFKNSSSITSKTFWRVIFSMLKDTFIVYYKLKIFNHYKQKTRKHIYRNSKNIIKRKKIHYLGA